MLEWEGKLTSILFLPGCNLRCPFCHARSLVLEPDTITPIPFDEIKGCLVKKKNWIDGVCITGGEPLLQEWLSDLIGEIRKLNFKIMLETNGTLPDALKALLDAKSVDYLSMDIKAPFNDSGEKYRKATAGSVDMRKIKSSVDIIMHSGIDYEFRTTVVPGIVDGTDIEDIAKSIEGARRLCLQQFVPKDTIDPAYLKIKPYPKSALLEMAKSAEKFVKKVVIRNA